MTNRCKINGQPEITYGEKIEKLHSKEYEDSRDAKYLSSLKLNEAFDKVFRAAIDHGADKINTVTYTGSNYKITENNSPQLYGCVKKACEILNLDIIPDIYMQANPYPNACATGVNHPLLIINDSLLKRMNHDEIMFVLGHELGHIKSQHLQYHLIGSYMKSIVSGGLSYIPVVGGIIGDTVKFGLEVAYYDWVRRSEYTSDHAGLLVCQNLKAAVSALAKQGGYPNQEMSNSELNEYIKQAQDFVELDEDKYSKVIKLYSQMYNTHPWTVLRTKELITWVKDGEYAKIILRCSDWLKAKIEEDNSKADRLSKKTEKKQLSSGPVIPTAARSKSAIKIETLKKEACDLYSVYNEGNTDRISSLTGKMLGSINLK